MKKVEFLTYRDQWNSRSNKNTHVYVDDISIGTLMYSFLGKCWHLYFNSNEKPMLSIPGKDDQQSIRAVRKYVSDLLQTA